MLKSNSCLIKTTILLTRHWWPLTLDTEITNSVWQQKPALSQFLVIVLRLNPLYIYFMILIFVLNSSSSRPTSSVWLVQDRTMHQQHLLRHRLLDSKFSSTLSLPHVVIVFTRHCQCYCHCLHHTLPLSLPLSTRHVVIVINMALLLPLLFSVNVDRLLTLWLLL